MTSPEELSNSFLNSDAVSDSFFVDIVANKLNIGKDEFKVRLVLLSPATGNNENYISVLYRAKIKIEILQTKEKKSVDVIVKALITTLEEVKAFGVFPRESFVYENLVVSFEKIWLDEAGEKIEFGPKCIKIDTNPYEVIVLDDLKAANYNILDRKIGLNLPQTKLILSKLAKFHAASAVRYQKDGKLKGFLERKSQMPPYPNPADNPYFGAFMRMSHGFATAIKNYGDCDAYAEKVAKWDKVKILTQYIEVGEPMKCGFQVLNHGDFWLNNMMFKMDYENNAIDVSLIDFQLSYWGSPAADLFMLMCTSVADDVKIDHFDDFIEHYHNELSSSLKKLNYSQHIPTLAELHDDLLEKGSFICTCLMVFMFITKYDSPEPMGIETIVSGGGSPEMMESVFGSHYYKKALKLWLPFFDKRGFLDTLIV